MKTYIGVSMVTAEPAYKGTELGYRIRYVDGRVEWVPKQYFETAFISLENNPDLKSDKPSISQQMVDDFIEKVEVLHDPCLDRTTVVKATLKNGFIIVESSSCVSVENYDEEIGKEICMNVIKDKVWAYLGFLLATACNN